MRLVLGAVLAALVLAPSAVAAPLPQAPDCPVFPDASVWNKPVHKLPLHRRSAAIVKTIGAGLSMHADFGSGEWEGGPIGIPVTVVGSSQPAFSVNFFQPYESAPPASGGWPL